MSTEEIISGAEKINVHSAQAIMQARMSRPASLVTPNHPTSGPINPTYKMSSSTIPPTYPIPQPKPETRPTVPGLEISETMAL